MQLLSFLENSRLCFAKRNSLAVLFARRKNSAHMRTCLCDLHIGDSNWSPFLPFSISSLFILRKANHIDVDAERSIWQPVDERSTGEQQDSDERNDRRGNLHSGKRRKNIYQFATRIRELAQPLLQSRIVYFGELVLNLSNQESVLVQNRLFRNESGKTIKKEMREVYENLRWRRNSRSVL